MSDVIELRGLRVRALCGVLPEEKGRFQPFEFNIDVHSDLVSAAASDDLSDTVDYGSLCAVGSGIADNEQFDLLERFAGRVAEALLEEGPVDAVTVVVHKLRPPLPEDLASGGARIHRTS